MGDQPVFSTTEYGDDILINSFLVKKPTVNSSLYLSDNLNARHHHTKLWKGSHKYWCVLRRSQLSYYKDMSERKPEKVILLDDLIGCRIYNNNKLDIFTKEKTLRFKSDNNELIEQWNASLNLLLNNRKIIPDCNNLENNNDDDDDKFDTVCEVDIENKHDINVLLPTPCINNGPHMSDEDKKFYEIYNPNNSNHLIQSGVLYGQVARSIGSKKWKQFKAELTNVAFTFFSLHTHEAKLRIDLSDLVDCLELDSKEPCFAVITFNQRLKFKALNEQEFINWLVNLKSCLLVRNR